MLHVIQGCSVPYLFICIVKTGTNIDMKVRTGKHHINGVDVHVLNVRGQVLRTRLLYLRLTLHTAEKSPTDIRTHTVETAARPCVRPCPHCKR